MTDHIEPWDIPELCDGDRQQPERRSGGERRIGDDFDRVRRSVRRLEDLNATGWATADFWREKAQKAETQKVDGRQWLVYGFLLGMAHVLAVLWLFG